MPKRALVLSGGGARGAYEAGVLRYLFEAVPEELGKPPRFDIVCGTSVGAINCAWVASQMDSPTYCARRLWYLWRNLKFSKVVKPSWGEIWRLFRQLFERVELFGPSEQQEETHGGRRGGLLDTSYFQELVRNEIPFRDIAHNLAEGYLDAVTVSTTDIVSGRTTVFAQTADAELPPWTRDPRRIAVSGALTAQKVLASAAIPILFPAVRIGSRWFCDGGLRQNTPLNPALRLGADRVMVITLHSKSSTPPARPYRGGYLHGGEDVKNIESYPNYLFLIGKLLDALLLDPLDYDLMVLERINALLKQAEATMSESVAGGAGEGQEALSTKSTGGEEAGPIQKFNQMMRAYRGQSYRVVERELVRPSKDLGQLASRFASEVPDSFWGSRLMARVAKNAVDGAGFGESDLLSYLLFDSGYTGELLELGYRDAAKNHDRLVGFFS